MTVTAVPNATLGNVPAASGQPCQNHLVYGVNSGRWWLFLVTAGDTTHVQCYVSSSADLSSATWSAATTSPVLAQALVAGEGRHLAVSYRNVSGTDVVYVVVGTATTGTTGRVYAVRATLSNAPAISWGSWVGLNMMANIVSANTPDGTAVGISNTSRAWFLNSRLTTDRDLTGAVSNAVDPTLAFDTFYALNNLETGTVNTGAVMPLASGYMLAVSDGATAASATVARNHEWVNSGSATVWPAKVGATQFIATAGNGSGDTTGDEDKNDWGVVSLSTGGVSDVHFVRRNGAALEHFRFNGTSWGTLLTLPALPVASKVAGGVFLATDGTSVWCFYLGTDDSIRVCKWTSGGGWGSWATVTSNANAKTYLSGHQAVGNSQINLIWIEGGASPAIVVGSYSTAGGAPVTVDLAASPSTASTAATGASAATYQVARPAADTSRGNWTDQASGTSNIFQAIDEVSPSDADYITSEGLAVSGSSPCIIGLSALSSLGAGSPYVRYRYGKEDAGGTLNLQVDVVEGPSNTLVQSWTHNDVPVGPVTVEQAVTNTINLPSDLRLRWTYSRSA